MAWDDESDLARRLREVLEDLRAERIAWEELARKVGSVEIVAHEVARLRRHIVEIDAVLDEILTRLDAIESACGSSSGGRGAS